MPLNNIFQKKKTFIIAEIGNNHEGNFSNAIELVKAASKTGVNAVKFQTIDPENFVCSNNLDRINQLKKFKLSNEEFTKLASFANELGLIFFSTPFDIQSAEFLNNIQPVFKISSGDNNFIQLIEKILHFRKPTIISTGISEIKDIDAIYNNWLNINFRSDLALLHCVSSYPVPHNQAILGLIKYLIKKYPKAIIGHSGHTIGIDACCAAVSMGAKIIEKHFTLDKNFSNFRDHKLSADPSEMKKLVEMVNFYNKMIGSGEKIIQNCEQEMSIAMKRSIAASRNIDKDTKLNSEHLMWVRPASGYPPGKEELFIGKILKKNVVKGEILSLDMFEDGFNY